MSQELIFTLPRDEFTEGWINGLAISEIAVHF